jgi:hypothetical protein
MSKHFPFSDSTYTWLRWLQAKLPPILLAIASFIGAIGLGIGWDTEITVLVITSTSTLIGVVINVLISETAKAYDLSMLAELESEADNE